MANDYAYLVMVDSAANNNKFYEITENDDGSLDTRYGRNGGKEMHHHYESYEKSFYGLMQEKLNKGYEDCTSLHSEKQVSKGASEELSYKPVEDEQVQEFLEQLITASREFMQTNYTVKSTDITQKMVDEAQNDIDLLNRIASKPANTNNLYQFNKTLEQLFTDVPRKMVNVADNLAKTENDFQRIIDRETDMINNVKNSIEQNKILQTPQGKNQTLLEANGLQVRPVTYKEEDQITTHLGHDYNGQQVEDRYIRAYAVENNRTRQAYEQYKKDHNMTGKDVRLFYHGSKVENWYSIMKQGLSLNPNASTTGKMFGQGLYFAPESRKSLNYMDTKGSHWNNGTRDSGYCAVYAVALGKCYVPDRPLTGYFTGDDLPKGTTAVFAGKNNPHLGLRNDEYVVYNQDACTIKYLMEMTAPNPREKEYHLDRKILRDNLSDSFSNLVKTDNGVRAEIAVEKANSAVQNEITGKIRDNADRLYIDYNSKSDTISLSIDTIKDKDVLIRPNITKDDYAFLSREMKKAFVECENDWKGLIKATAEYPVGREVATKEGITPLEADEPDKDKAKQKNQTIKE